MTDHLSLSMPLSILQFLPSFSPESSLQRQEPHSSSCAQDLIIHMHFTGIPSVTVTHFDSPSNMGQPSSVPRICSIPNTWDSNSPTVTASWFTVPRPPRRLRGAISEMYMGTSDVFRPAMKLKLACSSVPMQFSSKMIVKIMNHSMFTVFHVLWWGGDTKQVESMEWN